jgi:hypothetical protein
MPDMVDYPLQEGVRCKAYMSVLAFTQKITRDTVKYPPEGAYLMVLNIIRHLASLKPIVQVAGNHLNEQEKLVAFSVLLAVLVKGKAILKLVDFVLDIAPLVILVKNLNWGQIVNILHCDAFYMLDYLQLVF